jgi:hypothetical protein
MKQSCPRCHKERSNRSLGFSPGDNAVVNVEGTPGRNARATGLELTVTVARAKAQATGFGTRVRNDEATGLELTVTAARAKAQATGFGTRVRNDEATGVELTVTAARAEAQATGFVPPRQECPSDRCGTPVRYSLGILQFQRIFTGAHRDPLSPRQHLRAVHCRTRCDRSHVRYHHVILAR